MEEMFAKEGNNFVVMNQLFKNVFIRWDKKFDKKVLDIDVRDTGNDDKFVKSETSLASNMMSEILIKDEEGNDIIVIDVKNKDIRTLVYKERKIKSTLGKFMNYTHPLICFDGCLKKSELILNNTLKF